MVVDCWWTSMGGGSYWYSTVASRGVAGREQLGHEDSHELPLYDFSQSRVFGSGSQQRVLEGKCCDEAPYNVLLHLVAKNQDARLLYCRAERSEQQEYYSLGRALAAGAKSETYK